MAEITKVENGWSELDANQRDNLVGTTLGMKPLTQCFIGYAGEMLLRTGYTEEQIGEAQSTVEFMSKTTANWKHFLKEMPSLRPEMRGKLEVIVNRWHMRYSDTNGGGWDVIEWLRGHGSVKVESRADQWLVVFDDGNPHHGRFAKAAPTMAEAACLVALQFAPYTK